MDSHQPNSNVDLFTLVTKDDAARIFRVSTKSIDNYIKAGLLPAPVPFGGRHYWHPEIFDNFLRATFVLAPEANACQNGNGGKPTRDIEKPKAQAPRRDSSPAVRQKQRQLQKLKELNA